MKKIIVTIMVLSMVLASMSAMAKMEKEFTLTPRVAVNFATSKDSLDNKQGNQYGLLFDFDFLSCPIGFELGYMFSSTSNTQSINVFDPETGYEAKVSADCKVKSSNIPILATYNHYFNDSFYAKVGAGISVKSTKLALDNWSVDGWSVEDLYGSDSQTKVHFAWQAGLGYRFGDNWSIEALYYDQGKTKFEGDKYDTYYDYQGQFVQVNIGYSF